MRSPSLKLAKKVLEHTKLMQAGALKAWQVGRPHVGEATREGRVGEGQSPPEQYSPLRRE